MRTRALAAWAAAASLVVTSCSGEAEDPAAKPSPSESTTSSAASDSPAPDAARPGLDPHDPALDAALSRTVEDRVYPAVGGPGKAER